MTSTEVISVIWGYEYKTMILSCSSGDIFFFKTKGKLKAPLLRIAMNSDCPKEIFWIKHETTAPLLLCLTQTGRVYGYLLVDSIAKVLIAFKNGCKTMFAGEI